MRRPTVQENCGVDPLLLYIDPVLEIWTPYKDDPWSVLTQEISGMSECTETPGQAQGVLERLHLTVSLELSVNPPGGAGICN